MRGEPLKPKGQARRFSLPLSRSIDAWCGCVQAECKYEQQPACEGVWWRVALCGVDVRECAGPLSSARASLISPKLSKDR